MNGSGSRISPRDTQPCRSAQTSSGGSTTRALSSATATFIATMRPKSRSNGSDENDSTATPAIAVRPETMNARPVREATTSTASCGSIPRPRSSTKRMALTTLLMR